MKFPGPVVLALALMILPAKAEPGESEALAFGYAAAFAQFGGSRGSMVYWTERGTEVIRDIREVQAFGGVVLIRKLGGKREILDPARIVRILQE